MLHFRKNTIRAKNIKDTRNKYALCVENIHTSGCDICSNQKNDRKMLGKHEVHTVLCMNPKVVLYGAVLG